MCSLENDLYTAAWKFGKLIYGASSNKIYNEISNGLIFCIKINGSIYIPRSECERLIANDVIGNIEFHSLEKLKELDTKYISCGDYAKLNKLNRKAIVRLIEEGEIIAENIFDDYYILRSEVNNISDLDLRGKVGAIYKIPGNEYCVSQYTIQKLIKKSINRYLQNGVIKGEVIRGQWFVPSSEAKKIFDDYNISFSDYINIGLIRSIEDCLIVSEAARELRMSATVVRRMAKAGYLKSVCIESEKKDTYYISKEEIYKFKDKISNYKDKSKYFTKENIPSIFGISDRSFERNKRIMKIIKTPEFFGNIKYYHSSDIDSIRKIINQKRRVFIPEEGFITLVEARKVIKKKPDTIRKLIAKNYLPNSYIVNDRNCCIDKRDVEEFRKKYFFLYDENYITATIGHRLFGVGYEKIVTELASVCYEFEGAKYFLKKDIKDLADYYNLKNKLFDEMVKDKNKRSAVEYFKLFYVRDIETNGNLTETVKLYINYLIDELNISKTNNLESIVYGVGAISNHLFKFLSDKGKEIFELNDFEIEKLVLNEDLPRNQSIKLGKFANYVRIKTKDRCKYKRKFVRKYTPTEKEKECYDFSTFMEYAKHSSNIELHIKNSIEDPQYSQIWLYVIMHFCVAWRSRDILKLPSIDTEIVDIYNHEWFNNNRLSVTQCEILINQYYDNEYVANKTRKKIPFQVFKLFKASFATAVVICELHRKINNENSMFFQFEHRSPAKRDYFKFFSSSVKLSSFSSMVANRSLLTNFYHFTNSRTEFQKLAYFLARKLRGHVTDDMTWTYIHNLNKEEELETASKFIFDNEIFGFVKYAMAEIIASSEDIEFKKLNMQEKRKIICRISESENVYKIEAYNKFLLEQQDKKILIIDELLKMDKDHLINKMQKLYQGIMPAYIRECQCLKHPDCDYRSMLNPPCIKCEYRIPNKHFLIALNARIINTLQKIIMFKKEDKYIESLKMNKNLDNLIGLLIDACDEEFGLGSKVVKAYIDYDLILDSALTFCFSLLEEYENITSSFYELLLAEPECLAENIIKLYSKVLPQNIVMLYNICSSIAAGKILSKENSINYSYSIIYKYLLKFLNSKIKNTINDVIKTQSSESRLFLSQLFVILNSLISDKSRLTEENINIYIDRVGIIEKLEEMQNAIE